MLFPFPSSEECRWRLFTLSLVVAVLWERWFSPNLASKDDTEKFPLSLISSFRKFSKSWDLSPGFLKEDQTSESKDSLSMASIVSLNFFFDLVKTYVFECILQPSPMFRMVDPLARNISEDVLLSSIHFVCKITGSGSKSRFCLERYER